ncbi:hypothetical protein [Mycolicibacterium phlei]|jgi:hypothetical protein|uniref:hypothetical protein n=1 Tax=Mycolicibacterium phlei TaxID=1771 RepID=UPI00025AF4CB|nr:hypothetical protein [Mycolicibacterium phlei]EID15376.1 hypothetical protein MPHLEI_08559 [Mycolicibacterium phlei RIVM601174]MBF4190963.1 hypothetical protein [Mycolicibacterium phlei]
MSELNATNLETTAADAPTREPVLITEQQVRLGTAANLAPTPRWRRALFSPFTAVRTALVRLNQPSRPHYPKRHTFIEHAAMAREMDRL